MAILNSYEKVLQFIVFNLKCYPLKIFNVDSILMELVMYTAKYNTSIIHTYICTYKVLSMNYRMHLHISFSNPNIPILAKL